MKRLFRTALMIACLMLLLAAQAITVFANEGAYASANEVRYTAASAGEVKYKITTKICNGFQNGTNSSKVHFTFYGTENTVRLDNMGRRIAGDAFERNRTDTYEFSHADLGYIYALNVNCGSDGVKFDYIQIEKIESGKSTLLAKFQIGAWIDNTNKTFYYGRENIYRVKILVSDNPLDGTSDKVSMVVADTSGSNFTVNVSDFVSGGTLLSGSENVFTARSSTNLGTLNSITLKKAGGADDWRPLYVQIERMSGSTTAGNIIWESEELFVCDKTVGNSDVKISKYAGKASSDKAVGLASIFFEPNFYIITGIIVLLVGSGVTVYIVRKKKNNKEAG